MILNTGEDWQPTEDQVEQWTKAYPAVSVERELEAMAAWCDANPQRRKTARGISRFVNSWLSRAQDKGGSPMARSGKITSTKHMTSLDDLTHNFTGCPRIRARLLGKYGQCFEGGRRVTR